MLSLSMVQSKKCATVCVNKPDTLLVSACRHYLKELINSLSFYSYPTRQHLFDVLPKMTKEK